MFPGGSKPLTCETNRLRQRTFHSLSYLGSYQTRAMIEGDFKTPAAYELLTQKRFLLVLFFLGCNHFSFHEEDLHILPQKATKRLKQLHLDVDTVISRANLATPPMMRQDYTVCC